ncbi:hypothetical protein HPB50_028790 [Hyalomma asiaticum]|nr:hypothetical protein HPB50_028790 [Hyalomma asiaticum]
MEEGEMVPSDNEASPANTDCPLTKLNELNETIKAYAEKADQRIARLEMNVAGPAATVAPQCRNVDRPAVTQWNNACDEAHGKMRRGSKWGLLKHLMADSDKTTKGGAQLQIERLVQKHAKENGGPQALFEMLSEKYLSLERKAVAWEKHNTVCGDDVPIQRQESVDNTYIILTALGRDWQVWFLEELLWQRWLSEAIDCGDLEKFLTRTPQAGQTKLGSRTSTCT